jgi:hypothetical protein
MNTTGPVAAGTYLLSGALLAFSAWLFEAAADFMPIA